MHLHNVQITNGKLLKNQFDFKEIWEKLDIFLVDMQDIALFNKPQKNRILRLIKQCADKMEAVSEDANQFGLNFRQETEEGLADRCFHYILGPNFDPDHLEAAQTDFIKQYGEQILLLYRKLFHTALSENKKTNLFCVIFATHFLADVEIENIDETIRIASGQPVQQAHGNTTGQNKFDLSSRLDGESIELWNSNEPYFIRQYDFTGGSNFEIQTKKIVNATNSTYGLVYLHVLGENDIILKKMELKPGEFIYIHTLNGQFVRKVPDFSISNVHLISRATSGKEQSFCKTVFHDHLHDMVYQSEELNGITQFCADDDEGFVGIAGGKIIVYSNVESFLYIPETEYYVWVCVLGTQYIALAADGKVISNFLPVKDWSGVISISFTGDNEAYGIRYDGTVLSTRGNGFAGGLKNVVDISAYDNLVVAKMLSGAVQCSLEASIQNNDQYLATPDGLAVLKENSDVWAENCKIASDILEFAAFGKYIAMKQADGDICLYNLKEQRLDSIHH